MANKKISDLVAASSLANGDLLEIETAGGLSRKLTGAQLGTYIGAATSGTANRITVTAGAIDISAAYAGQTSIVTVGTISTGNWQGSPISPIYGGTGHGGAYIKGDILIASAPGVLTKLAVGSNGRVLTADSSQTTGVKWDAAGGGTPSLTATYVGYGDGSNLLTGASNFTFASNNLTITSTGRQIMLGGWVTLDTSYSALYFATPGAQNFALSGDNNVTFLNAPTSGTVYCQVGNSSVLELRTARANFFQPVYIGGTATPSAELHVVATTEQLRIGYDGSNYYSTTVASNGLVTFNAVGSGAMFLFTDTVNIGTGIYNDGGGMKHARVTTGSITGAATALVTVTWTTAFPDTNYTVQASVLDSTTSSLSLSVVHIESITASAITVRVINNAVGALTGTLHVIAIHD